MTDEIIEPTYLPFTIEQLRPHFAPIATPEAQLDADRHLVYYLSSAKRYRDFMEAVGDRRGMPLSATSRPCQLEKDERFWIVTCLMTVFHHPDRPRRLGQLMGQAMDNGSPPDKTWEALFEEEGPWHLFFEVNLPSPPSYKSYLSGQLPQRTLAPYIRDASLRPQSDEIRPNLEGPTHVDAVLLNEGSGFAVLFEAKVLSDCSYRVSFDPIRNQLARSIDVMLESNADMPAPLRARDPDLTYFVLLTPEIFRERPSTRLYGWLMREYMGEASQALSRDLPHRADTDWADVSKRLRWLTWEDVNRILPSCCPWLNH
jgi:hypothetical protein